ncbi:hypothetical protein C8F01DRAFT_997559, partial [Mycena amicta]
FFCLQLVRVGTISSSLVRYHENWTFYSAGRPAPSPVVDNQLSHATIQRPLHKGSLDPCTARSVLTVKKAMPTYARLGWTSSISICGVGMQITVEDLRKERMGFYADHDLGWFAQTKHDKDGLFCEGKGKRDYGLSGSFVFIPLSTA